MTPPPCSQLTRAGQVPAPSPVPEVVWRELSTQGRSGLIGSRDSLAVRVEVEIGKTRPLAGGEGRRKKAEGRERGHIFLQRAALKS